MPKRDYSKMDEPALVAAQIEVSNRRAKAESELVEEGLEIQHAIDSSRIRTKFENLGPGERATLRELLSEDKKNG